MWVYRRIQGGTIVVCLLNVYLSCMRAESCVRFIPLRNGINQNLVKRDINMHSCTHVHVYAHLPAHLHAYTYIPAQLHIKAIYTVISGK